MRAGLAVVLLMATTAQLTTWMNAHKVEHATKPLHVHTPPPIVAGLDTTRDGWGAWSEFTGADYGADCDFISGQVTDLGTGKRITAQRQTNPLGRPYVSGWYDTFGKFDFLYGTIEAKIRYPNGKGAWPAFWLLPKGQRTPFPEIDIFEAYPGDPSLGGPGVGVHTIHKADGVNVGQGVYIPGTSDLTLDYHIWKMVWTASRIDFYLDGVLASPQGWSATTLIPTVPMYVILSLALGNPHATAPVGRVDTTTPSPLYMDIEYVRVTP